MDLPLLLAGPILRRVEPGLVSVWLAVSEPCEVRLRVWEGRVRSETPDPFAESPSMRMLRIGAKLHVAEVVLELPATTGKSFLPDSLYSYDLEVSRLETGEVEDLNTLRMLEERVVDGVAHIPLGLEKGMLPSFAPPPSRLEDLNVLYGSCRRPLHRDPDALAMVDDLIFGHDTYKDPRARPHQLFLGGDQIYADDVAALHMLTVMEVGVDLIGSTGDPVLPDPVERVPVDEAKLRHDETKAVDPTPLDGYTSEPQAQTDADPWIPADRRHWPEGRRLATTLHDAQLTSTDGDSHLLSLGDFAATYLSVWSPAVWGEEVVGARWAPDASKPLQNRPLRWDEKLPRYVLDVPEADEDVTEGLIVMPPVMFPERIAGHLYLPPRPPDPEDADKPPEPPSADEVRRAFREQQRGLRRSFAVHAEFRRNLPKVQRALANVPTYMILDDHDVTDDYFLNPVWRRRVLGRRLGRAILGNAMIAYALFQDWGNDPVAYRTGPKAQLLQLVERLFPEGSATGPDPTTFGALSTLFGHREDGGLVPLPGGRTESAEPPLKWHFSVDGPKHRVIALDNRTRRQFAGENGPPGNVSPTAMVDQVPLPPLPAGREVLVVVAPLQVIGPPVLDELVAPLSYRLTDLAESTDEHSELDRSSTSGMREMLGTDPDAIEAWAFDVETFEHLLRRLEPYGRVVLLSGDVHYAAGSLMSYWRGDAQQPARFAQFTSSGFKNVMPPKVTFVDASLGLAQQLVRLGLGTERIGFEEMHDDLLAFPPGTSAQDLTPVMRSRLRKVPVTLPSWGWPDLNDPAHPEDFDEARTTRLRRTPDWRWRVRPLLDERPDPDRPAGIRLLELDPDVEDLLASPASVFAGYQKVAARHQHALNRLRNARQILFRANVGRLRFQPRTGGRLDAVHEVFTTFADPDDPAPTPVQPEAFLVQVAPLGPEDEDPPSRLRRRALQPPAGGA
jgi:hypothetical protein